MQTVHSLLELRSAVAAQRGRAKRIGFVPTMGNLHEGHLTLVDRARQHSDYVVSSIFVNPLQFGPNEDFDTYPRTLAVDSQLLEKRQCDLLYAPTAQVMYPRGRENLSAVRVPALADQLEGAFRPGFFDGVATVVSILFHQVAPDLAVFGEKDWQQLQVIKRMVADLHMPIEILGHPTARETDGLAMSSRNQYLSGSERIAAAGLNRVLGTVEASLRSGNRRYAELEAEAMRQLTAAEFAPQYVAIRAPNLELPAQVSDRWVVLGAALMGNTRLIDNRPVLAG